MGNDPHWTKEMFKIERVLEGKRATRYLVVGKKGAFLRNELQKVRPVTKKDPRIRKKAKQKKKQDKLDERKPPPLRGEKYISKFIYTKVSGEKKDRRGLMVAIHRDFALIMSRQKVLIRSRPEITKFTNEKIGAGKFTGYDANSEIKKAMAAVLAKHAEKLTKARERIDKYLDGKISSLS